MLNIKPKYIVEGCPVELTFETKKKKRVLIFYGLKPFLRLSSERLIFQAKINKSKITAFYWGRFFIKKEKLFFKVNIFKSYNIQDIKHELSGSIYLNKQTINSSTSFQKNIFKQPKSSVCDTFKNPVLKTNNQKSFKSRPVKLNLEKTKISISKKSLEVKISQTSMNNSFDLFREEFINNYNT